MGFPNQAKLKNIRKKLKNTKGFRMLDPDADELAHFRFRICQKLLIYAQKHQLTAVEMAKYLEITTADMSRIFNHRIDKFSTDKLVRLYAVAFPNYRLKVA